MNDPTDRQQQFTALIQQHKPLLLKVAGAYCAHPEDRKDLVQDMVLHLWKAFPAYNPHYAITTWMYRIALNVAISSLRKARTRQRTQQALQQDYLIHWQDEQLEERLQQLHRLIEQLRPLYKALIILQLEGCKQKEIAEVMGMSVSNVSTRLHRIRQSLTQQVQSQSAPS